MTALTDEQLKAAYYDAHGSLLDSVEVDGLRAVADAAVQAEREALESLVKLHRKYFGIDGAWDAELTKAEFVLAQQPAVQTARGGQEPVGHVYRYGKSSNGLPWHGIHWYGIDTDIPDGTKLYTTPPAAPVPEGGKQSHQCGCRANAFGECNMGCDGYVLVPQAWLVSLASVDFGHGDIWSDAAETAAAGMRAMLAAAKQDGK